MEAFGFGRFSLVVLVVSCVLAVCSRSTAERNFGEKIGQWELPFRFVGPCFNWLRKGPPELGPVLMTSCGAEFEDGERNEVEVELYSRGLREFAAYERAFGEKIFDDCLELLAFRSEESWGELAEESLALSGSEEEVARRCRYVWESAMGSCVNDVFLFSSRQELLRIKLHSSQTCAWSRERSLHFLEDVFGKAR